MKAKRINTTAGRLVTLSMDVTSSESMQSAAKLVGENVKSDGSLFETKSPASLVIYANLYVVQLMSHIGIFPKHHGN